MGLQTGLEGLAGGEFLAFDFSITAGRFLLGFQTSSGVDLEAIRVCSMTSDSSKAGSQRASSRVQRRISELSTEYPASGGVMVS